MLSIFIATHSEETITAGDKGREHREGGLGKQNKKRDTGEEMIGRREAVSLRRPVEEKQ